MGLQTSTVEGAAGRLPPSPRPVADFHAAVTALLGELGVGTDIWPVPVEIVDAIAFPDDQVPVG